MELFVFSENFKLLRKASGITQTVSKLERCVSCPSIDELRTLSVHFGTSVSSLYYAVAAKEQPTTTFKVATFRKRNTWLRIAACVALVAIVVVCVVVASVPTNATYNVTIDGKTIVVDSSVWITPQTPTKLGYKFAYWTNESGASCRLSNANRKRPHVLPLYERHLQLFVTQKPRLHCCL